MDMHEILKEHDQIIADKISNIDESVLAETEKIINSKEFKKSWRKESRRRRKKWCRVKNVVLKHCLTLISLGIGAITLLIAILDYIFK